MTLGAQNQNNVRCSNFRAVFIRVEETKYFPRDTSPNTSLRHASFSSRGPTGTQRAPLLHPPLQPQQQQQQHQLLQQQQQLLYNQQYQPRHSSNGSPWEVLNSYRDMENNEIVRRAKKMVWQANDMYDFVRGRSWRVRTTQGRRGSFSACRGVCPWPFTLAPSTRITFLETFHRWETRQVDY